jgi:hypothetical protein
MVTSWGCGIWSVERDVCTRPAVPIRGRLVNPGLEEPAMFKLPAFDPVGIAVMGFGVLAIVALAFVF